MKKKMAQNPTMPNVFRDEEGSVMTEFLIVAPFLFTIVFGVFFYTDLNRFQIAAHEHAYIQAWQGVASNRTNLSPSDEIEFSNLAYAGGFPGPFMAFGSMRQAIMIWPPIQGGDARAGMIYSLNNLEDLGNGVFAPPYEYQSMPVNTLDRRELALSNLGGAGNITYQNSTYLTPLWGAANSFIGKRDQDGADAWIAPTNVTIPSRMSIINDPYSVYWGNKGKRLRYADRFTIMRDPVYGVAALVQTIISGKLGIIDEIPTILDDLGYTSLADALSWLDNPVFEFIGDIVDVILKEQAEPLRKVDKRMDEDHDTDGEASWGKEEIRNELELDNANSNRWTAIQ